MYIISQDDFRFISSLPDASQLSLYREDMTAARGWIDLVVEFLSLYLFLSWLIKTWLTGYVRNKYIRASVSGRPVPAGIYDTDHWEYNALLYQ